MDNTQLTVLVDCCVIQIKPDHFFDNSTLTKIRKLFRCAFQEPDRNTETIAVLGGYLPAEVAETKAAWHRAGVEYTNGYVDTKFRFDLNYREKQAIERANKKLLAAVKRAKAKHERYQKILTAFEAIKNKNTECTE